MNYDRMPISQFGDVLQLSQRRPVFTADFYAVDGGSGKVASFVDWNDFSHLLSQAASGNQVAVPATHADFSGKLCATFTGAEFYLSNRASSSFSFAHNGTGFTGIIVLTTSNTTGTVAVWGTTSSPYQIGVQVTRITTAWASYMASGVAVVSQLGVGAAAAGVATYLDVMYVGGQSPAYVHRKKSAIVVSGGFASAPSYNAPTHTLVLGATNTGTFGFVGRCRAFIFTPALADAERAAVQSWIQQDTGIVP